MVGDIALLAEFRRAETRSGANQEFFVQKRFKLRSVIATIQNLTSFQGEVCLVRQQNIVKTRRGGVAVLYSLANPKILVAYDALRRA